MINIRLKEMLAKRDMTLYRLAKETGLAYNALNKIKNGEITRIYLETLDKVCLALDCTPNDILTIEK